MIRLLEDISPINQCHILYELMPSFDDVNADKNAQKIIQETFPDRKVIAINGIDISMGGGNVHCITQQQPLGVWNIWIYLLSLKNTTIKLMKVTFQAYDFCSCCFF